MSRHVQLFKFAAMFWVLLDAIRVFGRNEASRFEACEKTFNFNDKGSMIELERFLSEHAGAGKIISIDTKIETTNPLPITMPASCENIDPRTAKSRNQTGGVFDINITDIGVTEVYCDTETDGGQWIVFQRRMDGSENFDRSWSDYVDGFGIAKSEFWLGLEKVYQLTKYGDQELRIDMIGRNSNEHYYAKYSSFVVGHASDNYKLSVRGYDGNVSDAMTQHDKCVFSTPGNDDTNKATKGCAEINVKGGWWCRYCKKSNLNGVFNAANLVGIRWRTVTPGFVEMKLRKQR